MKTLAPLFSIALLALVSACAPVDDQGFSSGDPEACEGVVVAVNYGILGEDAVNECVEFDAEEALAADVLAFAGIETAGTDTYGDQVVCRVNGLPSETEELLVPGFDPHRETCEDMPPAHAYWALWVKADADSAWDYAMEGVGTLMVSPESSLGLAFSAGDDIEQPSTTP
jgi:hypothetical protein